MNTSESAIYKFYWDCGRMGSVDGVFVASKDKIKDTIGKMICFSEILGKHSEVYGPLEEKELTLITDDPAVVALFIKHELSSGYNPLQYIQEENQ